MRGGDAQEEPQEGFGGCEARAAPEQRPLAVMRAPADPGDEELAPIGDEGWKGALDGAAHRLARLRRQIARRLDEELRSGGRGDRVVRRRDRLKAELHHWPGRGSATSPACTRDACTAAGESSNRCDAGVPAAGWRGICSAS